MQKDVDKYIYESPDRGNNITRRPFGSQEKENISDIDIDVNHAILINSMSSIDGTMPSVRLNNKELWDIPVDLYSTKVKTMLSEDILQQLEKMINGSKE